MATIKIASLPSATVTEDTDLLILDQEDATRKLSIAQFKNDLDFTPKTDLQSTLGSSLVGTPFGGTLQDAIKYITPEMFGAKGDGVTDDTISLKSSITYAKANRVSIYLSSGKTYKLTGSSGLDIDLGYFSFGCPFGMATIDATTCTAPYVTWVHSSVPYTLGNRNHSNTMRGVEVRGSIQSIGQALLLIGNNNNSSNGTYNGDCTIEHCSFVTADKVILATNSTWRYKFIGCGFTMGAAGTHIAHFPSGLSDSGESVSFDNCKIYDTKRCPFLVACSNFSIAMSGTSVLNAPIEISGAGALVVMDSASNIENPGATAWYRYVKVTGVAARFILDGSTLVCNQPSLQTQPLFEVTTNAFIIFNNVKTPGNNYPFQTAGAEGLRTFIEGDGYVLGDANIGDISSGAGNIPLHKSLNTTRNYGFATGDISSWSFNNQGSPSQTAVVSADYKKTGAYGVRLTSIGTLSCFLTQNVKVNKHNYYTSSLLVRTITSSTGTSGAGSLTVTFYDRSGQSIQAGATSTIGNTVGDWVSIGEFIQGRVPQSAEYAEISIRCREGAVIDVDSFIINFY